MTAEKLEKGGWENPSFSKHYRQGIRISTLDIHYGYLAPGEEELRVFGGSRWVKGKKTLEIACGAAQNSIVLAKWGARRCVGVDISEDMLEEARHLSRREGVKVELMLGDAKELVGNLFSNQFDLVISSYGVGFICRNIGELEQLVLDVSRVLSKGGRFVFCLTHPEQFPLVSQGPDFEWNETRFTIEEIRKVAQSVGLRTSRIVEQITLNPSRMSPAERSRFPYEPLVLSPELDHSTDRPHTIIYLLEKRR